MITTDAEWLRQFALIQKQTNELAATLLAMVKDPAGVAELGHREVVLIASLLRLNVQLLTGVLPLDDEEGVRLVAKNIAALEAREFESRN